MIERNLRNERVAERHASFLQGLESVVSGLGIEPPADYRSGMDTVKHRRWNRRQHLSMHARLGVMTVRDHDGVLLLDESWRRDEPGGDSPLDMSGRRASASLRYRRTWRRSRRKSVGDLVAKVPFERLDRSDVASALEKLDEKLTPHAMKAPLRELGVRGLRRASRIAPTGRVLLFVHGTFSNSDNWIDTLEKTPKGLEFLAHLRDSYDQVATFDHRTLGVSPLLNARELGLLTRDSDAHIDVVCHSRGGLVVRWWLEALDRASPQKRRAVFVGSPLAGTGLAAPPRLRGALSNLANINRALASASSSASAAVPFLSVAAGIFRIVSSVTSFAAKTPVIDAAVALVPGLHAMSRVGNNRELLSLRRDAGPVRGRYFSVQANFESDDPGWKFWRYFRGVKSRVADWATDQVFEGHNDLVVDTPSMVDFQDRLSLPSRQILNFGTQSKVHHTNYFEQARTLRRITSWLK